jgi:integrase
MHGLGRPAKVLSNGVSLDGVRKKLPAVFTQEEVKMVFKSLSGSAWLMATLLYGSGLRLMECIGLRVKDVDFAYIHMVIRGAVRGIKTGSPWCP